MQRFVFGALGIIAVVLAFSAFVNTKATTGVHAHPAATTAPAPAPAPAADTSTELDQVTVTTATRIPEYRRDRFGKAWADVDHNSCNTRDDILARDLTGITTDGHCKVLTGTLNDPYTGKVIVFQRGEKTSATVQIDHVQSLSGAWKAGAYQWTDEQRTAFANDPENLLAVDGPTNTAKSDKGPAQWMPHMVGNPGFDCTYATRYVHILVKYQLTAPAADLTSLRSTLAGCH